MNFQKTHVLVKKSPTRPLPPPPPEHVHSNGGTAVPTEGFCVQRMDAMAADRVGAAKRRRERRLRQFLRHERLSVALALAAAQHHFAPKSAGPVTYDALRGEHCRGR